MTDIRDMLKFDEPTFTEGFTIRKIRTILDSSFKYQLIYVDGLQNLTNNTWFEIVNESGGGVTILTKNIPLFSSKFPYWPQIARVVIDDKTFVKIFFRNSESPAFYSVTQQIT